MSPRVPAVAVYMGGMMAAILERRKLVEASKKRVVKLRAGFDRKRAVATYHPNAAALAYTAALIAYVRELKADFGLLTRQDAKDNSEERAAMRARLPRVRQGNQARARRAAERAAADTARHQREWLGSNFGLSAAVFYAENRLPTRQFIERNVELINSIGEELHGQMVDVLDSAGPGVDLIAAITDRFDVAESRAELIATDQTLKFAAEITESVQRSAGLNRYQWSTSKDEKVRDSHAELDGKIFSWDAPPTIDGEQATPGSQVRCRCAPIPVLDGLTAEENAAIGGVIL
jgi:SPP1 gp7 family putative phage head morphogenesis protein